MTPPTTRVNLSSPEVMEGPVRRIAMREEGEIAILKNGLTSF
jgi:hypothetical protein